LLKIEIFSKRDILHRQNVEKYFSQLHKISSKARKTSIWQNAKKMLSLQFKLQITKAAIIFLGDFPVIQRLRKITATYPKQGLKASIKAFYINKN
jgi:hypothetical protein